MDFKALISKIDSLGKPSETLTESVVAEKAVSKKQQKFMGMVHAAKKGEKPASKEVADVAKGMSKKAAKDFASTKHKGLPEKKKAKKESIEFNAEVFREKFEDLVEAKAKPDYLDMDKDGDKKEPMKKALKDKKKNPFAKKDESVKESDNETMKKAFDKIGGPKGLSKAIKDAGKDEKKDPKDKKTDEASCKSKSKKKMNESFEFVSMMKMVKESGGQQAIDPIDTVLWTWANRVANSKLQESSKAELFAAMIYERNGGEFELYDVLSESTVKKPEGINEDVSNFINAGIPKQYAEKFLKKYQVKNDAKITPIDGVPKASDISRESFIINVLPNGDVRGFGKKGDDWKVGKDFYSVLHMVDGKFVDTGYESVAKAKQGMSKKGEFYTLDGNMWSFYRDKKPDSGKDTRGDVMTGDGDIYGYMNDTFMKRMRPMMEKMVDDIYANLRKLDNKKQYSFSPTDQERALEAAKTIEAIAERGFNRSTMENFLTHLKRASYGLASIPANERELRKILKDTPNARAKWAKTVLDAAKRQHERVKDMLYKPTVDALKGEPA